MTKEERLRKAFRDAVALARCAEYPEAYEDALKTLRRECRKAGHNYYAVLELVRKRAVEG